ncbi:MAG: homoserine dehydrogenase [Acidobacteria bacterium]|nr:homoserine dehydrogenase [Acidobacteriota bacterium]
MSATRTPLTIGLAGFGTVGRSVARILCEKRHPNLRLAGICTRRVALARAAAGWVPPGVVWTDDVETLIKTGTDIFVEVIGGIEPARTWIAGALGAGRSVVTANKQVIAEHGRELIALARQTGQSLRYEAAVGGVVPVIRGVQDGLSSDHLTRIVGVVNGTCNFVLTEMAQRRVSMSDAVADAQARGLAEQDPSADLDGIDARAKLAILATIGFDGYLRPADIPTESIRAVDAGDHALADELGYVVRQIAWADRSDARSGGVAAGVLPALVDGQSWLARANGSENVVLVRGERSGQTVFAGQGAGGDATAIAVVSDLLAIAAGVVAPRAWSATAVTRVERDFDARHYVRVSLPDPSTVTDPTLASDLASVLDQAGIRPERVWQERCSSGSRFAALVSSCSHLKLNRAIEAFRPAAGAGRSAVALPLFDADR